MSSHDQHVALGAAIAAALRDAAGMWGEQNPGREPIGDRLAQYVESIEVRGELKVGGPFGLVVEVRDRRRGRSTITSYVLERSPKSKVLFRRQSFS